MESAGLDIKTSLKSSLIISVCLPKAQPPHLLYLTTYLTDIFSPWATSTTFLVNYSSNLQPFIPSTSPQLSKAKMPSSVPAVLVGGGRERETWRTAGESVGVCVYRGGGITLLVGSRTININTYNLVFLSLYQHYHRTKVKTVRK